MQSGCWTDGEGNSGPLTNIRTDVEYNRFNSSRKHSLQKPSFTVDIQQIYARMPIIEIDVPLADVIETFEPWQMPIDPVVDAVDDSDPFTHDSPVCKGEPNQAGASILLKCSANAGPSVSAASIRL